MGDVVSRYEERDRMAEGSPENGEATGAIELLALHDEADRLRQPPSAVGLPGLVLFIALFVWVLNRTDLGLLATLGVSLLVATPGLVLVGKDLKRTRRLQFLERRIAELGDDALEETTDNRRLSNGPATDER